MASSTPVDDPKVVVRAILVAHSDANSSPRKSRAIIKSLSKAADDVFVEACCTGDVATVRRLAAPPFCISIKKKAVLVRGFHGACNSKLSDGEDSDGQGRMAVIRELGRPPFGLVANDVFNVEPTMSSSYNGTKIATIRAVWTAAVVDTNMRFAACLAEAASLGLAAVMRELAMPPWNLGSAAAKSCDCFAFALALRSGKLSAIEVLFEAPYSLTPEDVNRHPERVIEAINNNPNVERIMEALASKPYMLSHVDLIGKLTCFVSDNSFSSGMLRALAKAPYSFTKETFGWYHLGATLSGIGKAGNVDALRVVAMAPYNMGRIEMRKSSIFKTAVERGHADLITALGRPPFALDHADASEIATSTYEELVRQGKCAAFKALISPPYDNAGHLCYTIPKCILLACEFGRADILRTFGPDLNARVIEKDYKDYLFSACNNGHHEVLQVLGKPPFSLDSKRAHANGTSLLIAACAGGHTEVVRELSRPPWNFGQSDARANEDEAMRIASDFKRIDVIAALHEPPYNVPK